MSFSRIFLGDVLDFHVASLVYAEAETRPLYFLLGDWRGFLPSCTAAPCSEPSQ